MRLYAIKIIAALFLLATLGSCGSNECQTCTLNTSVREVCEDNWEELTAADFTNSTSYEAYIRALEGLGFECE